MICGWQEIGDPIPDRIIHPAGSTAEFSFQYLLVILRDYLKSEISLADGAADNVHERTLHMSSSRRSIIWVTSGPVEMRVIGQPISSSAVFRKSLAFFVSFA